MVAVILSTVCNKQSLEKYCRTRDTLLADGCHSACSLRSLGSVRVIKQGPRVPQSSAHTPHRELPGDAGLSVTRDATAGPGCVLGGGGDALTEPVERSVRVCTRTCPPVPAFCLHRRQFYTLTKTVRVSSFVTEKAMSSVRRKQCVATSLSQTGSVTVQRDRGRHHSNVAYQSPPQGSQGRRCLEGTGQRDRQGDRHTRRADRNRSRKRRVFPTRPSGTVGPTRPTARAAGGAPELPEYFISSPSSQRDHALAQPCASPGTKQHAFQQPGC